MQDPYEEELRAATREMLITDDDLRLLDTPPSDGESLQTRARRIRMQASRKVIGRLKRSRVAERDKLRMLNRSKSQRVAQFARDHNPPKPVKVGLGLIGLLGLIGGGFAWWRKHRK